MPKIIPLLFCIVGVFLKLSASTSIEYGCATENWTIVKRAYYCEIINNPSITTRESATIASLTGNHKPGKSNSDVEAIYASSKTIHYFPRGFDKSFENIKVIQFGPVGLKEVHQEDLKQFPKLIELQLYRNSLEVLEDGLFDFNPVLENIKLDHNKISHIGSNVFDHLSKLRYLNLESNSCIDKKAVDSTSDVKDVIQETKTQCH